MGLLDRLRRWLGGGSSPGDDSEADIDDLMGWTENARVERGSTAADTGAAAASTTTASAGASTAGSGAGSAPGTAPGEATPRPDYECAVCGTGVGAPDEQCPLCRSSDVRPVAESGAAGGDQRDLPAEQREAPTIGQRQVREGDDDTVRKLRELSDQRALLERHADRWRPAADGFRIETPDGERTVDSPEALVVALEALEGAEDADGDEGGEADGDEVDADGAAPVEAGDSEAERAGDDRGGR